MNNQNGKIVTVYGGSGFLGKYVVKDLANAGYTIKVICRDPEECKDLKTCGFVGQVVLVQGDFRKHQDFEKHIKGSYAVINLVGILYETSKQRFAQLHAQSPERLAKTAKELGIPKFIHVSAIVETTSNSKYAKSKINGEKAVLAAFPSATILKPSVVFGPEDKFFNMFASLTNFSPFLPLIAGGKTKFQPVYVGDVAKAALKSIEGNFKGSYELGGPQILSFRQVLNRVLKYTNRKRGFINQNYFFAKISAILTPSWVLTTDQVELLKDNNIVHSKAKKIEDLGIKPTAINAVVPKYLSRHKKYYSKKKAA